MTAPKDAGCLKSINVRILCRSSNQELTYMPLVACKRPKVPSGPRLALSKACRSISLWPRRNQTHFSWLIDSAIGRVRDAFATVASKEIMVFNVTPNDHSFNGRPSNLNNTTAMLMTQQALRSQLMHSQSQVLEYRPPRRCQLPAHFASRNGKNKLDMDYVTR